jgi:hypothetical protein
MKTTRRKFIHQAGIAGAALGFSNMISCAGTAAKDDFSFVSPIDGDMLTVYDGTTEGNSLAVKAEVKAPAGKRIRINSADAHFSDGRYISDIRLNSYKNVITATDLSTGDTREIIVYWLQDCPNKYRFSIDDNIWFLKDITQNAGKYHSIFDNPYLRFMKEVHDTYSTKIHFNLFYQTDGFTLSDMTGKFKNEWKENAEWINLSFHALQEFPDKPYQHSGYDEVKKHCEIVMQQIERFAGKELLSTETTLHWGEATQTGSKALRDCGYRILAGYFDPESPNPVSYYLDKDGKNHLDSHFFWKDHQTDIIFSKIAVVINLMALDQIVPYLEQQQCNLHRLPYVDLMIHEQYFYSYYKSYQPDFRQKVEKAVQWATEKGYRPAYLHECIL